MKALIHIDHIIGKSSFG